MFRLSALWERNAAEQDGEDGVENTVSEDVTSGVDAETVAATSATVVENASTFLQFSADGVPVTASTTAVRPSGRSADFAPDANPRRNVSAARDRDEEPIADNEKDNYARDLLSRSKIETIEDAVNYCSALIQKQLERSREKRPPPNTAIYGDAESRRATLTLLPDTFVRDLFLRTTRDFRNWPRIKPLFGSPPYVFLRPEDAGLINASGISSKRSNMAYSKVGETASYSQFGNEHLVDRYGREYRVVPSRTPLPSEPLPCDFGDVAVSRPVLLNIRIPKRPRDERLQLFSKVETRQFVMFPRAGEVLEISSSPLLKRVRGITDKETTSRLQIRQIVPRSATSSTAAIIGVRVA